MSVEIKGLDALVNKLNRLSNIKGKQAVEMVASEVLTTIRGSANTFSNEAYQHIGMCDKRAYESGSYFVEIGLKNDYAPFDSWKNLWFQNWGYHQYYYGHPTGKFTSIHVGWFNNAVNSIEDQAIQKMKSQLRKEIKACLE